MTADDPEDPAAPRTWRRISNVVFTLYALVAAVILFFVVLLTAMYGGCFGNMGVG